MIKVVFFGSDQYSEIVFQTLKKDSRYEVSKAPEANLLLEKIKKKVKSLKPDVGILASYGKILDKEILSIPKHGILNIHPSMLPKYRGPTPIPSAILNGETQAGVSIIKMDEEVDHGPILAQFKIEIFPEDTAETLLKRCFTAGAQVLITILPSFLEGKIELKKQDHPQATFSKRFTREEGRIDWKKSDEQNERFIRAMQPWPGAWTEVETKPGVKQRLKIHRAHLENEKLILDEVQLEGKKPVSWKQFQEGYPKAKIT